jgi:ketosteroid isomerase-like protein
VTASANLDLVRSIFAAWERGDYSSVEWAHPEIEFVMADGPTPERSKGLSGMTQLVREGLAAFQHLSQEAEDFQELDGARVVVLNRYAARGKASGLSVEARGANVFHVDHGRVSKLVHYWDRDRALADLGLAPEGRAASPPD